MLAELVAKTRAAGGRLHFLGLVSDGGVHSHVRHLQALIEAATQLGQTDILVHALLDGRDTPPKSGVEYVRRLDAFLRQHGSGRIGSLIGRFYAMDRD